MTFEPTPEDYARSVRVAHQKALEDIESCHEQELDGQRWLDTRPMTDPREHSPEVLDMAAEALAHADCWKLIRRHPTKPYLVRVNHR